MVWWLVVSASGGLIVLGVLLLVRDYFKSRKANKRALAAALAASLVPPTPPLPGATRRLEASSAASAPTVDAPPAEIDGPMTGPILPRVAAVEARWPQHKAAIANAVSDVNGRVATLNLAIGAPGDPSWSLHNHGYGDYRRVYVDGDSLAWMRMELAGDRGLLVKLRVHDAENAMLNGSYVLPPDYRAQQLADAVMEVLSTMRQYAEWRQANVPRIELPQPPAVEVTAPLPEAAIAATTTALADAAIAMVNTAFVESGARLMPLKANQWPGIAGREARVLAIDANGALAGTMLVDPRPDRIEIAVTAGRSATANAAQRQTLPLAGLTIHALAEKVAISAWPAIVAAQPQAL